VFIRPEANYFLCRSWPFQGAGLIGEVITGVHLFSRAEGEQYVDEILSLL
jgi:hypothetical protein